MMANDSKVLQLFFFEICKQDRSLADQTVIKSSFLQGVKKADYESIKVYLDNGVDAYEVLIVTHSNSVGIFIAGRIDLSLAQDY